MLHESNKPALALSAMHISTYVFPLKFQHIWEASAKRMQRHIQFSAGALEGLYVPLLHIHIRVWYVCDELWQKRSPRPRGKQRGGGGARAWKCAKAAAIWSECIISQAIAVEKNESCSLWNFERQLSYSSLSVRIRALRLCALEICHRPEERRINNSGRARCTKFAAQPTAVGLIMINKQTCALINTLGQNDKPLDVTRGVVTMQIFIKFCSCVFGCWGWIAVCVCWAQSAWGKLGRWALCAPSLFVEAHDVLTTVRH